jgi:hypothetical protein
MIMIAVFTTACSGGKATTTPFSTMGMTAQSKNIATGTIIVAPGEFQDITFYIDGLDMYHIEVTGYFHAAGGSKNDIELFVIDDADYSTWKNGRSVSTVYNTGRQTYANVKFTLRKTFTRYHMVFNNVFSNDLKTVQVEITMKYYIKTPTTTANTTATTSSNTTAPAK